MKPKKTTSATAPKQELMHAPAFIVNQQRSQNAYIIDTISKTALSLVSGADSSATVSIMERLWSMQKEAEDRQAEREFGIAKVAIAMDLPTIPKNHAITFVDKKNQTQSHPYADRADIEGVLDPICRKHGFSKEYSTDTVDGKAAQVLTVRHVGGHKEVYRSPYMPLDTTGSKNNNQAAGSTSEYGKRYALIGAFNIIGVDKDDDGTGGTEPGAPKSDKFSERVQTETKEKVALELPEAASALAGKLTAEPDAAKRGEILMKNIKIVGALDETGDHERAESLRKLAETGATNA